MLGLKIFVRVQTLRRRPFVPSHNFCHPGLQTILFKVAVPAITFLQMSCLVGTTFLPPCVPDTRQLVRVIQVVGRISLDALLSENKIAINLFRKSCHTGDTYTDKWLQRNKNSVCFWPNSEKRFITQMHNQQLTLTE